MKKLGIIYPLIRRKGQVDKEFVSERETSAESFLTMHLLNSPWSATNHRRGATLLL